MRVGIGVKSGVNRIGLLVAVLFVLAGCNTGNVGFPLGQVQSPLQQAVTGETIGSGAVRVALLVPLSSPDFGDVAQNIRNAAALALQEFQDSNVQILVKDSRGTAEGARAAASEALAQGAELILGPLLSQEVSGAAAIARPAGIPIIAFSTDALVAAPGVYLLSFLPRADVQRIIAYAATRGNDAIAALIPNNAYGTLVEAALRESVANAGSRLIAVERYEADQASIQQKAQAVAAFVSAGQVDTVFIPAGDAVPLITQTMAAAGVSSSNTRFIGSGQWNDPVVLNAQSVRGGWFPAADPAKFNSFAARYAAAYGAQPVRTASLGYDATILAAGLTARFGSERFSAATLTNASGFNGMDGVFRFLTNGLSQRTLGIFEVTPPQAIMVDPPPQSFAGIPAF